MALSALEKEAAPGGDEEEVSMPFDGGEVVTVVGVGVAEEGIVVMVVVAVDVDAEEGA